MTRAASVTVALLLAVTATASSQIPDVRGYYLNVGVLSREGPLSPESAQDFQRLRLMVSRPVGFVEIDLAYEQMLILRTERDPGALGGSLGQVAAAGDWLPLQRTLRDGEHVEWRHRVDRAALSYRRRGVELILGRQPISWATTLFLTPADPFAPFDPTDPFREYRAGVDALRVRAFPGPFSELDGVVRVAEWSPRTSVTALARGRAVVRGWDLGAWAGVLHDSGAAAVSMTFTAGGAAVRGEGVLRFGGEGTVLRATLGLDRSFDVWGRNLYVVVEYQRDGYGATGPGELTAVALSGAYRRGELQVTGRDVAAAQASIEIHPLFSTDMLALWDLNDRSVLAAPGLTVSAGDELTLRGGLFLGVGAGLDELGVPGSAFGLVPTVGYVALTAFF
ncbi:MAG: hypothetical protein ACE5PT_07970 [Gemmatimonadales bacterium]